MPIRPSERAFYPIDWRELSASIRFGRAAGRCEGCGRPHKRVVLHLGDGRWYDDQAGTWRDGKGRAIRLRPAALPLLASIRSTRVVLATAHRNHDTSVNDARNLAAWCQRCHIIHDRPEHAKRARFTILHRRALGDLFLGPYPKR